MNVDIEDEVGGDEAGESRFFVGLAEGGLRDRLAILDMAAELKPAFEFAVEGEQHAGPGRIENPRRAGDVALGIPPIEGARGTVHELNHAGEHFGLAIVVGGIAGKKIEKAETVIHDAKPV